MKSQILMPFLKRCEIGLNKASTFWFCAYGQIVASTFRTTGGRSVPTCCSRATRSRCSECRRRQRLSRFR